MLCKVQFIIMVIIIERQSPFPTQLPQGKEFENLEGGLGGQEVPQGYHRLDPPQRSPTEAGCGAEIQAGGDLPIYDFHKGAV